MPDPSAPRDDSIPIDSRGSSPRAPQLLGRPVVVGVDERIAPARPPVGEDHGVVGEDPGSWSWRTWGIKRPGPVATLHREP